MRFCYWGSWWPPSLEVWLGVAGRSPVRWGESQDGGGQWLGRHGGRGIVLRVLSAVEGSGGGGGAGSIMREGGGVHAGVEIETEEMWWGSGR